MAKSDAPLARVTGREVMLSVNEIDENPRNCNRQPKAVFAKLVQSIREFGFVGHIVVREKGDRYEVIGGAHRLRAATVCKMRQGPCVNVGIMSDVDAARLLITLNETHGSADQDSLSAVVTFIKEEGGEEALQVLPYTDAQLSDLLDDGSMDDLPDDDEAEEPPPDERSVKIKPSDIAAMFELEGVAQDTLKRIIISIRKWRQRKSAETPAYELLLRLMKDDQ